MSVTAVGSSILEAGLDDWVAIDEVMWFVIRERGAELKRPELYERCVAEVRSLAEAGFVDIGDVRVGEGFVPWGETVAQTVERLRRELFSRVDEPRGAEYVAWLRVSPSGRALEDR